MQMIYRQLRKNHPLLQMIERCLDFPENRPSIREVLHLLEQARAEDNDEQMEMSKLELLRALQTLTTNQDSALHVELQSCMREVAQLQQRLQSCMQQLARKESELRREQEDVKKAHQQIHQLREQESNKDELIRTMGVKLAEAEQQLIQLSQQVTEKDELLESNQMELFQAQEELNSMEQATWSQVGDEHASETTLPTFLPEIPKQECASSSQMLHAVRPTPKPRTFVNRSRSEPVQQVCGHD
jgi:chromosome segregation ATPase